MVFACILGSSSGVIQADANTLLSIIMNERIIDLKEKQAMGMYMPRRIWGILNLEKVFLNV